jgi:hypothetical protein
MPYVFNPFSGTFDWTAAGVPTLTTGGVTFGGTSGELAQDSLHFNYNSTSDILSVSSGVTERITNGGFTGNANGWTLPTGWTYSSNSVSHSSNGTGALTQSVSVAAGERYEVSFTISNLTVGTVSVSLGGVSLGTYSANGTYTARIVILNTSAISFAPSNTARLTIDNVSAKLLTGGTMQSGNLLVQGSGTTTGVVRVAATGKSNSQPGTTRHVLLENNGSNSWIDFKFSNVDRAHIGANSSGQVSTYVSGGNYDAVYNKATNTLISYNTPNVFGHYGYGGFQTGVNAGSVNTPSSTLMSQGGTALKVKYITANQTLDNTATEWIVDPSAAACNGSPTNACSSYTSEFDCLARDAHGGCVWSAGTSCSIYDGDEINCISASGCTWDTANCDAFGDEYECTSNSGCSWNYYSGDCSSFYDEETCNSYSGCYWDGASCSGYYDYYACEGYYSTGTCSGSFGSGCSGTATCNGIDDQTNCNNETGCSWATAISLTLPSITSCPDRDYWIYNASSTNADVILVPSSGDTVDHTTSLTLSNFKERVHISPLRRELTCSTLDEGTCGTTSGCSQDYASCSWNYESSFCENDASCASYGDQESCDSATYYTGCSGNYLVSSNWYVLGK